MLDINLFKRIKIFKAKVNVESIGHFLRSALITDWPITCSISRRNANEKI